MRLGINTFLFTSPFNNKSTHLFKQIKGWGFDTVELPIEDPRHIDPKHIKRELDKSGLVCGSICACMGPDRDLRGTARQQKIGLNYLTKILDQMVVLDCPSLIGPVYSETGRADAVPRPEYRRQWKTVAADTTSFKSRSHDRVRRSWSRRLGGSRFAGRRKWTLVTRRT